VSISKSDCKLNLYLHEAIAVVLVGRADGLAAEEIAQLIAEHDLYRRPKDGQRPPANQVSARIDDHPELFEIDRSGTLQRVKLKLGIFGGSVR